MSNSNPFAGSWETPDIANAWHDPPAASIEHLPMVPLTAPGMPPPGPNFVRVAMALGDLRPREIKVGNVKGCTSVGPELTRLYKQALYDPNFYLPVNTSRGNKNVAFIPGHRWWAPEVTGPRQRTRVMLIGTWPAPEEVNYRRHFHPSSFQAKFLLDTFARELARPGFPCIPEDGDIGYQNWHVVNLVRFPNPLRGISNRVEAGWRHDCLPLLHMELRLVRPDFILALGAEVADALLGPNHDVGTSRGKVFNYCIPLHESWMDMAQTHRVRVVIAPSPAVLLHKPEEEQTIVHALRTFARTVLLHLDEEERHLVEIAAVADLVARPVQSPVQCRRATLQDLEPLLPAMVEARRPLSHGSSTRSIASVWGGLLSSFFEEAEGDLSASYVALNGDTPIGAALVHSGPSHSWMPLLFVHPAFQRRGVGTALLSLVMRDGLAHGYTQMTTWYDAEDKSTQSFLTRFGFRKGFPRAPAP